MGIKREVTRRFSDRCLLGIVLFSCLYFRIFFTTTARWTTNPHPGRRLRLLRRVRGGPPVAPRLRALLLRGEGSGVLGPARGGDALLALGGHDHLVPGAEVNQFLCAVLALLPKKRKKNLSPPLLPRTAPLPFRSMEEMVLQISTLFSHTKTSLLFTLPFLSS